MKLVQVSSSWCKHCPPAAKIAQTSLNNNDFILVMEDVGQIVYDGEGGQDEITAGVTKVIEAKRSTHYPNFRIVDDEFNIVETPDGIMKAISRFKELNKDN